MNNMNNNLPKGTFVVGNSIYGTCSDCGSLVKVNKFIFGSFHICLSDEEKLQKQALENHSQFRPHRW